jgi:hypothetical protein
LTAPKTIKAALACFLAAILCEAYVEFLKLLDPRITVVGYTAIAVSLLANPLTIYFGYRGRRWARDMLVIICVATLAWPKFNREWLNAAGLLPLALITFASFLRFGAVIAIRRPVSNQWFDAYGSGSGLRGFRSTTTSTRPPYSRR